VGYRHETTIEAALKLAKPCDWILIAPGVYPGSVVIRNRVIVDGRHRKGSNGIEIRSDGVWVENLTVRNFDRATANGEDGNQIWWHDLHGWHGNYLTVYGTGLPM
jgi:hypothetical protein